MKKKHIVFSIIAFFIISIVIVFVTLKRNKIYIINNRSVEIFEPDVSTFSFPVYLAVKDLQNLINQKVKKEIINKQLSINEGKDSLIIKVDRLNDIDIKLKNNDFSIKVPLKLEVSFLKNIGLSKNVPFFKKKPITILLTANFRSEVSLNENLSIKTKTRLVSIDWLEEPTLTVFGINFDIKKKVSSILEENSKDVTSMIDKMIQKKVDLRKPINRIWGKIQKSLPATKHQKDLFVKIQPQTVAVYINKNNSDSLKLELKVTSKIYVRHGSDTSQIKRTSFPSKVEVLNQPSKQVLDNIQIHALLKLSEINKTLNEKLVGKSLKIPNFDVSIANIRVYNGIKNIAIQVDLKGTILGSVYVKGRPVLSNDKSKFYIKDLDFESNFRDKIFNSFSDLLHDQLRDLINDNLKFDLTDIFSSIPNLAQKSIDTTKMAKKAEFNIQQLMVDKLDIHLTKNSIQLVIFGKSDFEINIKKEGLKFKKPGNKKPVKSK